MPAPAGAHRSGARPRPPPPFRRTPLIPMLMMRALGGLPQPIQKLAKHCLALQGRLGALRVLMMLPAIASGVAAKRVRVPKRPPCEVSFGPR